MANTITNPVWVKTKPHASAEKMVGDSDPNARTDVENRVSKGVVAVVKRLINTLFDGATADFTDQTTVSALAGTFLLGPIIDRDVVAAPPVTSSTTETTVYSFSLPGGT